MASLTVSSSDLTASFIATSLGPSSPKDNRTSTLMFPMYTPDSKHVCDLELGGTTSVPYKVDKMRVMKRYTQMILYFYPYKYFRKKKKIATSSSAQVLHLAAASSSSS
ncbi:hypothetical protein Ahy_A03g016544 isoform B [Arachis hypogaea]|uniref:Uncharacterized protein n=1 Tax=Arachis hypogaea TaxID=3818 RepID=A0A445E3K7_ARAHY|nr:hypothetical protein Ahy_A03g016544 isoform B [Arachis hypogaea]